MELCKRTRRFNPFFLEQGRCASCFFDCATLLVPCVDLCKAMHKESEPLQNLAIGTQLELKLNTSADEVSLDLCRLSASQLTVL